MLKFEPKEKIRIFLYHNLREINRRLLYFKRKLRKYNYSLLHSTNGTKKKLRYFRKLGFFRNPKSLFIVHVVDYLKRMRLTYFIKKKHVYELADYGRLIYVNPNYFGNFNHTFEKNKKVCFYVTSSLYKYYSYLILGAKNLKKKSINFEINVSGHTRELNKNIIPKDLRPYFIIHGFVNYKKLFDLVQKSDFIIINLFPHSTVDQIFKTYRATGSVQLSYGFYKPPIIEEQFAKIYKFNNQTGIIFKKHDLISGMERAAKLTKEEYKKMSKNVKILRENIYNISLNNLKQSLQ